MLKKISLLQKMNLNILKQNIFLIHFFFVFSLHSEINSYTVIMHIINKNIFSFNFTLTSLGINFLILNFENNNNKN